MQRLDSSDPGFEQAFARIVADRRESDADVSSDVRAILADVRNAGDAAVVKYTQRFDGHALGEPEKWRLGTADFAAAFEGLDATLQDALTLAAARIETYHRGQVPTDTDTTDSVGMRLGARWRAVDAAGIYVPGGRAAYPSSLLMNAIPAKVAGVPRIVAVSPAPQGAVNPLVLAAAHVAGLDTLWKVGGAQAVAALAYGTQTIAAVDVVTGPGNAWVAEAKRQLYGVVGIDMVAGPSEILVIADRQNTVEWIVADLLSQAEHDPSAQSILLTDDAGFAAQVADRIDIEAAMLPTATVAQASWRDHGVIVVVPDLDEAVALANRLAAEHVELAVADPEPLFAKLRHAGSVFLGRQSPEAIGDYVAGPNHVLPTGRRARFSSGLSVLDFMKRTSFLSASEDALAAIGPAGVALAEAEGLPAHAKSISLRLNT
ncbi:MAG: histidinol dehydrogenase [Parerythrobacter sp.]